MQRLVLAVLIAALVIGVLAVLATGLRAAMSGARPSETRREMPMQKFTFFLLLALFLYVAGSGAS